MYGHEVPENPDGFYGVAVAGGFVYRGSQIPALDGQYLFADFGHDGRFFVSSQADMGGASPAEVSELRFDQGNGPVTLGQVLGGDSARGTRTDARLGTDEAGEIYVTTKADGWIRKLVPA